MSSIEDRGPPLRAALIVYLVVAVVAVFLRFWSRALAASHATSDGSARFWWDDWFALAALPWVIGTCALAINLVDLGVGKHVADVPPEDQLQVLKVFFAVSFVYDTAISLVKFSALFFYARVFSATDKSFRYCLWGAMGLTAAWLFGICMMTLFTCVPVEKAWVPSVMGTCIPTDTTWLASAIPSAFIDFIILLLPMPMLWKLQMKRSQKILLTGVFACGYCVLVISLGRVITISQAGFDLQLDLTWDSVTPLYWLGAEGPISLFSVCLPSIFFFVRRAMHEGVRSLFSSHRGTTNRPLRGDNTDNKASIAPRRTLGSSIELSNRKPSNSSGDDEPPLLAPTDGIVVQHEFNASREDV